MIEITIGSEHVALDDFREGWLLEQLHRQSRNGVPACAQVRIRAPGVAFTLCTPACGGGGSSRRLSSEEERLVELWTRCGLIEAYWRPVQLIQFLKQLATAL